ncbi:aldose epimerase family protein [Spirosoma lituiforme]
MSARPASVDRIRLSTQTGGASMVVAPAWGGRVCALLLPLNGMGHSVLDGFADEEVIQDDQRYKSAPLIPFPNRVNGGRYVFEGETYQLPINEARHGHAIHGLLYNRPMTVEDMQVTDQTAQLGLTYAYDDVVSGYPFPFELAVTYWVSEEDGFRCATQIRNTDSTAMPLGVGWHPYLSLPGGIANWTMQLPDCQIYKLDDVSIPTGSKENYSRFVVPTRLADIHLNDCFGQLSAAGRSEIVFTSPASDRQLVFWMESGANQYRYFQLFTPPDRLSIAVEPMSCCSDAVNNHDGLIRVESGDTFMAFYGLQLRPTF